MRWEQGRSRLLALSTRLGIFLHILSMWLLFWLQVLRHWNARPKAKYDRRRNNRPTFVFLPFRPQFRQHFFYGNGEPLANPNVFEALSILTNPDLFGLSQRRITLSTIGMIPGIRRMTKDYPQVNLAYSLHSPFEDQRNELMPINKKYPLHDVIKVLDSHIQHTGRKVFIAYILLNQINDSMKHAEALANLLQGRDTCSHLYHVDLIPYNYTDKTEQHFTPSSYHQVQRFQKKLRDNGIEVTVRAQFGSRVNAACGQLYVDTEKPH